MMLHSVNLPDKLFVRLQALGGGLFTVQEVIAKLAHNAGGPPVASNGQPVSPIVPRQGGKLSILQKRSPRERGVTVDVDGQRVYAGTVTDLYEQVFRLVLSNEKAAGALDAIVPFRTSNQRYLVARESTHPNGRDFFVDVKVGSYHVEAHKNYEQAVKQLADLLARIGMALQYVD